MLGTLNHLRAIPFNQWPIVFSQVDIIIDSTIVLYMLPYYKGLNMIMPMMEL